MFLLWKKGYGRYVLGCICKIECFVFGYKCGYCNKDYYLEIVCWSKDEEKFFIVFIDIYNYEGGIFEFFCVLFDIIFKYYINKIIVLDYYF